ncbi:MAG TPA: hypothetical protein VHB77_09080 [Planctomycetaceae bacterium]|nr:hypothetical protein [Planctomycetaceae bacterium]
MRAIQCWLLAALVWAMGGPAFAAETSAPTNDEPAQLVRKLGDDSFEIREHSGRRLLELGPAARQALQEGSGSSDPEVRIRSTQLLALLHKVDVRQRVAAFLADDEGKLDHHLPGWERFREQFGRDRVARELFAEMHKAESELIEASEAAPKTVGEMFQVRAQTLQQMMFGPVQRPLSLGSVAALLFLGSDTRLKVGDDAAMPVYNLINQNPFQQAITSGQNVELSRRLLAAWIERRSEGMAAYQNLFLAQRFDLKEGLHSAISIVRTSSDPNQLQMALLMLGRFGKRQNIADLTPVLDNKTQCSSFVVNNKQVVTQVRDVALAVAVHLAGQPHKDFGFTRVQMNPQLLFNVTTLGFEDEAEREAAFHKWKIWSEGNLEQPKPEEDPKP